jgi:hypothetical protein
MIKLACRNCRQGWSTVAMSSICNSARLKLEKISPPGRQLRAGSRVVEGGADPYYAACKEKGAEK